MEPARELGRPTPRVRPAAHEVGRKRLESPHEREEVVAVATDEDRGVDPDSIHVGDPQRSVVLRSRERVDCGPVLDFVSIGQERTKTCVSVSTTGYSTSRPNVRSLAPSAARRTSSGEDR